jgi:hypothetical protein
MEEGKEVFIMKSAAYADLWIMPTELLERCPGGQSVASWPA